VDGCSADYGDNHRQRSRRDRTRPRHRPHPRQHHPRHQAHPAGEAPYCVLPGGHLDETDNSLEDALRRELREELAGDATILRLVDVIYRETERQYFYLATMDTWSFADRTGPEFSEPGRGSYELEEISSRPEAVAAIALKPDEIAVFLASALSSPGGLAALPDLREWGRAQ
jgi:8-oxo-dGTP pyrophosphatase MutT (NUDIX family)